MGLTYQNRTATGGAVANKYAFTSRARVVFTLSGETDTGLAFGGSFRADNAAGAAAGTAGSVFVSGDFGRLTMGDTDGAAQFVIGHVDQMSLTNRDDLNEITYLGNNTNMNNARPTARYDYTIDGFTVAVSHTNPGVARRAWSVAAGYKFDGFSVGLGYERQNAAAAVAPVAAVPGNPGVAGLPARDRLNHIVFGAGAEFEGIKGKLVIGRASGAGAAGFATRTQGALSVSGSFDAVTVTAFGRRDFNRDRFLGLGASYDLGGGASVRGGVVNTNFNAAGVSSRTVADFGLNFTF